MKAKQPMLERFNDLDREMRSRFSELATSFDFARAEHEAIEAVRHVHRLADKARTILEDDFDFEPGHQVLSVNELARAQAETQDYKARYLAVECEVINFLTTLGLYNADGPTEPAGRGRTTTVSTADLNRLARSVEFIRAGFNDPTVAEEEPADSAEA